MLSQRFNDLSSNRDRFCTSGEWLPVKASAKRTMPCDALALGVAATTGMPRLTAAFMAAGSYRIWCSTGNPRTSANCAAGTRVAREDATRIIRSREMSRAECSMHSFVRQRATKSSLSGTTILSAWRSVCTCSAWTMSLKLRDDVCELAPREILQDLADQLRVDLPKVRERLGTCQQMDAAIVLDEGLVEHGPVKLLAPFPRGRAACNEA